MSTGKLREELHRIGDTAPVADVDPGTWGRARQARTRDRALGAGAVLAVCALVVGLAGVLPSRDAVPVVGSSTPGVPDHLYSVPVSAEPEATLAVGTGAAAWMAEQGLVVVVGAVDGAYHLMSPPGFPERGEWLLAEMNDDLPLALSPDGTRLAYGWFTAPRPDGTRRTGVRVVDLRTGRVRTVSIEAAVGVLVTHIGWSRDGRWLSWSGDDTSRWDDSVSTGKTEVAGRIAPGATDSEAVPLFDDANRAMAVGDDGSVWIATTNTLTRWDGHRRETRTHPGRVSRTGQVSPTGDALAVGVGMDGPVANPAGRSTLATLIDPASGDLTRLRMDEPRGGQSTAPLGWVGDRLLVAVSPFDGDGGPGNLPQRLELLGSDQAPATVGTVDVGVPRTLTIATDLMTPDRPTVERPEPHWPWSDERRWSTIGLGVAGALGLVGAAWWLWRRRTSGERGYPLSAR